MTNADLTVDRDVDDNDDYDDDNDDDGEILDQDSGNIDIMNFRVKGKCYMKTEFLGDISCLEDAWIGFEY